MRKATATDAHEGVNQLLYMSGRGRRHAPAHWSAGRNKNAAAGGETEVADEHGVGDSRTLSAARVGVKALLRGNPDLLCEKQGM
jgi:hypothetical protein